MLDAAKELHQFFHDAREVLAMIQEKENLLTDDLGRDLNSVHQLQRSNQVFASDLVPLGHQVKHPSLEIDLCVISKTWIK